MKIGFALVALLSLVLAGCAGFGENSNTPAVVYYVLNDPAPAAEPAPLRAGAPTLLVLNTTTGGFYDTDQLIFSRSAGTRGQYQFARWTERPASALPTSCARGSTARVPGMSVPPAAMCAAR